MYALYCAAYYTTHHANTGLDISTGIDDTLDGITGATNGNSTIDTTTSLSIPNEFANVSISSHGIGETHDGSNNGTTFEIETSTKQYMVSYYRCITILLANGPCMHTLYGYCYNIAVLCMNGCACACMCVHCLYHINTDHVLICMHCVALYAILYMMHTQE